MISYYEDLVSVPLKDLLDPYSFLVPLLLKPPSSHGNYVVA